MFFKVQNFVKEDRELIIKKKAIFFMKIWNLINYLPNVLKLPLYYDNQHNICN